VSYNVAYKRMKALNPALICKDWFWFVLKDRKGKVRDWAPGVDAKDALRVFNQFRDYGKVPKGYTVEKRGPVTRENW